jgi:hypothetical protein
MKKLFTTLIILILCSTANAVTTIRLVDEGTVIDASLTGGVVKLEIENDNGLSAMDVVANITGDGLFSGAMNLADCSAYGWDPTLSMDPIFTAGQVEIGAGTMGTVYGLCGYVEVTYTGPVEAVISLHGGGYYPFPIYDPPIISPGVVTIIPEPATLALLGLGALVLLRRRK